MILFLLLSLFLELCLIAGEYTYPLFSYDQGSRVVCMHQKERTIVELLILEKNTGDVYPCLWSLFKPTNVTLLPDESGFSFIDNGRLRIKYFNKRSVKTVDFDHKFYSLTIINWMNSQTFYCSAKIDGYYAIVSSDLEGDATVIYSPFKADALFPQKVNDTFFFIERKNAHYAVKSFCSLKNEENTLAILGDKPISFLQMMSHEEGFFVEFPKKTSNEGIFHMWSLSGKNGVWKTEKLFAFSIPSRFYDIQSRDCLMESVVPLLPKVFGNTIHFVDSLYIHNKVLESFEYDIYLKRIKKSNDVPSDYFVPIFAKNCFIYGGKIDFYKTGFFFSFV